MRAEDKMPRLSKLIERLGLSERVAVHAIPITVGGQAEGAVGGLAAAAITEKTAGVAGDGIKVSLFIIIHEIKDVHSIHSIRNQGQR